MKKLFSRKNVFGRYFYGKNIAGIAVECFSAV